MIFSKKQVLENNRYLSFLLQIVINIEFYVSYRYDINDIIGNNI